MRPVICFLVVFAFWLVGCSSNTNPTVPPNDDNTQNDISDLTPGVIGLSDCDGISNAIGMLGAYELSINPVEMTANLIAKRTVSIGESYIVSGIAFFTISPCTNCLKIKSVSMDDDNNVVLTFNIRHPFPPGDAYKPPTAVNRLDLDVFDVSLVVHPKSIAPTAYPLMNKNIYSAICVGTDGYTTELADFLSDSSAMPYFLVVDDSMSGSSTFNKFAMGANTTFQASFNLPNEIVMFDLYLTMGYGASAKKPDRLVPKYYNPEFNRKSAWKVDVIPPGPAEHGFTWSADDDTTTFDVEVHVYDWQQGATVYANPSDFANAPSDNIYALSDVVSVAVEIPGMTNSYISSSTHLSGDGKPNNPLIYKVPISNENLLEEGVYVGLVKVSDSRVPSSNWQTDLRDYLIDTPNGIVLNNYTIPEYATYQVFEATVVEKPFVPPGDIFWAKSMLGPDDDQGFAIAALSDNSTIVSGYFRSTMTLAQGEPNQTTLTSAGQNDIFIARYDPNGALVWAKRVGASGWETTFGIDALSDDSVVITGIFGWTVTFGQGEPNQTTLTNYPNDGVFVARYNKDGSLQWAKSISGSGRAYGLGVEALSDDSTIITGWFAGTYTFGSGEPNQISLTNPAGYNEFNYRDIFVAKYNPNGTLAWAKRAGGSAGRNDGIAVSALSDNSAMVAGYFTSTATFGQGETNQTSLVSSGAEDIFIAKYNNSNGTLAWAKRAGGSLVDSAQQIATLSDDTVVVTGNFADSAVFGNGEPNQTTLVSAGAADIFIARYNNNGVLNWAKSGNGSSGSDVGYAVDILPGDIIVTGGHFTGEMIFDAGLPSEKTLTTNYVTDTYIAWHYPDGIIQWAKQAATGTAYNSCRCISVLSDNSIAITGVYRSALIFGPGDPYETSLNYVAGYDGYIARFGP